MIIIITRETREQSTERERDQYKNDREREVPASQQNNTGKEKENDRERECQPFFHCLSSLTHLPVDFIQCLFEIERASIFSVFAIWFCI